MTPEQLEAIKTLLQLGWPALVTVFLVALWRTYEKRVDERFKAQEDRIQYLEDRLTDCLDGKI